MPTHRHTKECLSHGNASHCSVCSHIGTHYAPSGLGGVFEVAIVEDLGECARVRIVSADAEWNGKHFIEQKQYLRPIQQ
jgi:hypothetical protein